MPDESSSTARAESIAGSSIDQHVTHLTSLIEILDEQVQSGNSSPAADAIHLQELAAARLGIAASLFIALRCKHSPTAAHSLRVALGCSSWSFVLNMQERERDELEIAALLHDVAKIGVPDSILLKPGTLLPEEGLLMDQHRLTGLDIVRSCSASSSITDIIRHSTAWYDGTRPGQSLAARDIPLSARILAIVDAFDSMTTDQVYRRALSRERAMSELFRCAGTQFDPDLVKVFAELYDPGRLHEKVAERWLCGLDPTSSDSLWQLNAPPPPTPASTEALFQQKLLDNMHDAVFFVDRELKILLWNRGAERLTGIAAASVEQRVFSPTLVQMRDDKGHAINDSECAVAYAIKTGVQSLRRLTIRGRNDKAIAVDFHAVPVVGPDGTNYGAAVLLHDASPEASLEQRCQSLHERATKDPLTQVANRAEFDRTHQMFVAAHLERKLPCSLIICDIDHFKQVNDVYGHQAGDEVLKNFANVLKSSCRPGDLVARYGGEEFVILCADCNNASAAHRADQIRRTIAQLPQDAIEPRRITVSFGVTEIQSGDTPETMLRRADRALLEAKQRGRNTVVQLGTGIEDSEAPVRTSFWQRNRRKPNVLLERSLTTPVPMKVALEKLRGFVADHHAQIISVEGELIQLKVDGQKTPLLKRNTDRPVPLLVELSFAEERFEINNPRIAPSSTSLRTKIQAIVRPTRDRDRRRSDIGDRARHVIASIKSYLMAEDSEAELQEKLTRRSSHGLAHWLRKRD